MSMDDSIYAAWVRVFFFPLAIADWLDGNRRSSSQGETKADYAKFFIWTFGLVAVFALANLIRILVTP